MSLASKELFAMFVVHTRLDLAVVGIVVVSLAFLWGEEKKREKEAC